MILFDRKNLIILTFGGYKEDLTQVILSNEIQLTSLINFI